MDGSRSLSTLVMFSRRNGHIVCQLFFHGQVTQPLNSCLVIFNGLVVDWSRGRCTWACSLSRIGHATGSQLVMLFLIEDQTSEDGSCSPCVVSCPLPPVSGCYTKPLYCVVSTLSSDRRVTHCGASDFFQCPFSRTVQWTTVVREKKVREQKTQSRVHPCSCLCILLWSGSGSLYAVYSVDPPL